MNIIISTSTGLPIYEQISNGIKEAITKGELLPDEALPSIRSLAGDLKVSVITTKRAFEELEKEGFLYTIPGKGSFVAPHNIELIRESKIKELEDSLQKALDISKILEIPIDELIEIMQTLDNL